MNRLRPFLPRLLAGVGTLTLLAAIGLFASRPARTAGGPIPVTVANAPLGVTATEGQPVEGYVAITDPIHTDSRFNLVYTVPAGKQLIVESMSLFCDRLDNTDSYSGLVFNVDSTPIPTLVSYATLSAEPGTSTLTATTQPMRLHVGPGGKVAVSVFKTGTVGINAVVSLSGHLVDVP